MDTITSLPAVRLFGRPTVTCQGRTYPLRAERRFQLLVLLALRAQPVDRDWLAALFWAEHDNATARRNLRKLAFGARALPGAENLDSERGTLCWRVTTDLAAFEAALAANELDTAIELVAGPLCDGIEDAGNNALGEFLRGERDRCAQRWRTAVLARLSSLADEPARALALAQRLLDADALDEDAVAAAMRAHATLGHAAETQRAYARFKSQLAETMGIEPSSRLRTLADALSAALSVALPVAPSAAQAVGSTASPAPAGVARSAAPPAPNEFIGRLAELAELRALLARSECRLLTIIGPGGSGKSRLARAALPQLEAQYPGGVWWVPLDDLDHVDQFARRTAQLVGQQLGPQDDALARACDWFARRHALLVLDNAERIDRLGVSIMRLLRAAPDLKIAATSRERIAAEHEWLLPLHGMSLPPDGTRSATELRSYDSVRLFEARARHARPDLDLTARLGTVVDLVRALGGLPLAIELAAHWVRLLPIDRLLAEVRRSLDVLEVGDDGDERPEHRSVRATFEQSWRLLAPLEQRALAALSVCTGSFSHVAARAIAEASLPLLAALADKSLVQVTDSGRFALHPLIQQFAREKLHAAGGAEATAQRHGEWFLRLFAQRADAVRDGERETLDEIEHEFENCRSAWHWACTTAASEVLGDAALTMMYFTQLRGRPAEGLALLEQAATRLDPERSDQRRAAGRVLRAMAQLQYRIGQLDAAIAGARRALRLCRESGDGTAFKSSLGVLGLALWQTGRYVEAKRCFEQALRRARADGDAHAIATNVGNLGLMEKALGNYDRALELYREAIERQTQVGDRVGVGNQYLNLGNLHRARGEWDEALRSFEFGLAHSEQHGHERARPWYLINLALTAFGAGQLDRAADFNARALELAETSGNRQIATQALLLRAQLGLRRESFDEARADVRRALDIACAMGHEPIQLDSVANYAAILAAEGDRRMAIALLEFVVAHPRTEAADRAEARVTLAAWRGGLHDDAHDLPSGLPSDLPSMARRVLDELAPRAQAA